ncbi:uncharacterized protein [Bemisia tabaci]|uniref:uncharacterized protein isoform X2 n=1 Tax=Bemisia tabaci TaxID=7038 RepID=UPI003B27C8ED
MEELILTRDSPNDPWGFRLTGGKNFGTPLTVVKVTGGGIAESAGVQVGDMVMGINNEETASFSHSDAQKAIINAGDHLILTILRGSPVELPVTPLRCRTPVSRPDSTITVTLDHVENLLDPNIVPSDADVVIVKNSVANRDAPVDIPYPEAPKQTTEPSEEEIAELMLENAEVIDDYNVIGVNFQRFVPKCDFIKNSLVFQALQDEAIRKEKSEEEILSKCPDKRFSTFLVQPNRPKPVVKILLKDDKKDNSKNKGSIEKEELINEKDSNEEKQLEEENGNKTDSQPIGEPEKASETEVSQTSGDLHGLNTNEEILDKDSTQVTEELVSALENIIDGNVKDEDSDTAQEKREKEIAEKQAQLNTATSELSEFDKQLAQIQKQLASISILPTEIQSHLNQVQEQINKLLELKNKTAEQNVDTQSEPVPSKEIDNSEPEQENSAEAAETYSNNNFESEDLNPANEDASSDIQPPQYSQPSEDEISEQEEEPVRRKKWSIPREKPSFPLTPCLRPVVLPGGRKWRSPKDAYSEAFITETLVSQAEVLVGTTIGVNFRKYEPAKVDMSHSPTWRLIHNVEEPTGGIANRPERIPADCEYMEPIHARHFYVANLTINPDVTSSLVNQPEPTEADACT